jgi:hypothetical protein
MIPERDFALVGLTNCGPNGNELLEELSRWAFEAYAGVVATDPEPIRLAAAKLADYTGTFETVAATATITVDDDRGGLVLVAEVKPEALAKLMEAGEEAPENPPFPLGILPGSGDRYVVTVGPAKGMKGYFVRGTDGRIESVHVGGRLATRVAQASDAAR